MKSENVDNLYRVTVFVCEAPVGCLSVNLPFVPYFIAAVSKVNADQQLTVGMKAVAEWQFRKLFNE